MQSDNEKYTVKQQYALIHTFRVDGKWINRYTEETQEVKAFNK